MHRAGVMVWLFLPLALACLIQRADGQEDSCVRSYGAVDVERFLGGSTTFRGCR
jgi:hypothetical protein